MPCPVQPQPPGLFDGIPPSSAFGFWIAILSALLIGGILVGIVWGGRAALRQPLGSPRRKHFWVRLGLLGSGLVYLVLLTPIILWQLALDDRKSTLALTCTIAQDAVYHTQSEARALVVLIILLHILLTIFLLIYQGRTRWDLRIAFA